MMFLIATKRAAVLSISLALAAMIATGCSHQPATTTNAGATAGNTPVPVINPNLTPQMQQQIATQAQAETSLAHKRAEMKQALQKSKGTQ